MPEPDRLTLLCTANLAGVLDRFARASTLIQRERRAAQGPLFVLDLGGSCAAEAWPCRATEGRASLILLDAIGYDLAVVGGPAETLLPAASFARLREVSTMLLLPWDEAITLRKGGVAFGVAAGTGALLTGPAIWVDREYQGLPQPGEGGITVGNVPPDRMLRVELTWPEWDILAADWVAISRAVPPDPVLNATIELVLASARRYAEHQGGTP